MTGESLPCRPSPRLVETVALACVHTLCPEAGHSSSTAHPAFPVGSLFSPKCLESLLKERLPDRAGTGGPRVLGCFSLENDSRLACAPSLVADSTGWAAPRGHCVGLGQAPGPDAACDRTAQLSGRPRPHGVLPARRPVSCLLLGPVTPALVLLALLGWNGGGGTIVMWRLWEESPGCR